MTTLNHLSIGVENPKKTAEALANLTRGQVRPFTPVPGAFVVLWSGWGGQFIELYPADTRIFFSKGTAEFKQGVANRSESTHLNLSVDLSGDEVKAIAKQNGYHYAFREGSGGPLHEVWLENWFLLELVTSELRL